MRFPAFLLLAAAMCLADTRLGQPLKLSEPVPVAEIGRNPQKFSGKIVQVRGKVTEVCEMAGCWMNLVDPAGNSSIRIKVNDGEIVFPKTAIGKIAVAEGTLKEFKLTREQMIARAKHEAEEQGRKFNPDSVKSGGTIYQIQGTGAIILE
jgi:hypothetical protein